MSYYHALLLHDQHSYHSKVGANLYEAENYAY